VERAIRIGREHWPDDRGSEVLMHLIERGAAALEAEDRSQAATRNRQIEQLAERYGALFSSTELDDLREGWPE
jgi:hypothetical protein